MRRRGGRKEGERDTIYGILDKLSVNNWTLRIIRAVERARKRHLVREEGAQDWKRRKRRSSYKKGPLLDILGSVNPGHV